MKRAGGRLAPSYDAQTAITKSPNGWFKGARDKAGAEWNPMCMPLNLRRIGGDSGEANGGKEIMAARCG